MATLTIWSVDPLWARIYECGALTLAGWLLLQEPAAIRWGFAAPLLLLSSWGFVQLGTNTTVYRYATLEESLRYAALAATAVAAHKLASKNIIGERILSWMAWFGCAVAVLALLTYSSSPGKIFWQIPSPYPDVWGPFLSRNNFAQFLELCLPPALWLALDRRDPWIYGWMAAGMLAAGLASASRMGAALLSLEAIAILVLKRRQHPRFAWGFLGAALLLTLSAGIQHLAGRLTEPNPLAERPELWRSTWEMIYQHPWTGYGLGTFVSVYPEFAHFDSGFTIEHAHNDWLEWIAEGGWGFGAVWAWMILRAVGKIREPWALGVAAVFLHACVDFPMARLGVVAWAFLVLGAIEGSTPRPSTIIQRRIT